MGNPRIIDWFWTYLGEDSRRLYLWNRLWVNKEAIEKPSLESALYIVFKIGKYKKAKNEEE